MFAERSECLNMYTCTTMISCCHLVNVGTRNTSSTHLRSHHMLLLHGRGAWLTSRSKSSLVQYKRCSPRTEAFYNRWWIFNGNKLEPQETGRQSDAVEKFPQANGELRLEQPFETGASGGNEHEGRLPRGSLDIAGIGHLHSAKSLKIQ